MKGFQKVLQTYLHTDYTDRLSYRLTDRVIHRGAPKNVSYHFIKQRKFGVMNVVDLYNLHLFSFSTYQSCPSSDTYSPYIPTSRIYNYKVIIRNIKKNWEREKERENERERVKEDYLDGKIFLFMYWGPISNNKENRILPPPPGTPLMESGMNTNIWTQYMKSKYVRISLRNI